MTAPRPFPDAMAAAVAVLLLATAATAVPAATLRFDIVDKVGWGGDRAADIPKTVEETYAYDAKTDTITVTEKFDRKGFAPVPPMLALAAQHGRPGFTVTFDPKPLQMTEAGIFGPLLGYENSDGYSWSVQGLGRYVLERPVLGAGKAPASLDGELEAEVAKVVAAGHLAPWLFLVNVPGSGADERGDVYWHQPGETLYLLAEIVPALSPETAARLKAYLKAEREAWPPETVGSVPLGEGTRREVFAPPVAVLKRWEERTLAWRLRRPPDLFALYGLARYCEVVGEKPDPGVMAAARQVLTRSTAFCDWPTLYWLRDHSPEFNAVHGVNRALAGAVGCVRLAQLAGDKDAETLGWGLLARMAALRLAMGKYAQYMADQHLFNVNYDFRGSRPWKGRRPEDAILKVETDPERFTLPKDPAWWVRKRANDWIGELVTWNWSRPVDNVRQVHRLDETGVDVWEWCGTDCYGTGQKRSLSEAEDYWYMRLAPYLLPFRDMTPEVGRFMADHLRPEAAAYAARVVENQPHWYATYAEAILGAEQGFADPCDAHGHFNARAWILAEKPETLARHIDVPWLPRGDLYHLHKLAETVKAYRGMSWHQDNRGKRP
jgi:hypothetical protein